jgi:hypothetical protein
MENFSNCLITLGHFLERLQLHQKKDQVAQCYLLKTKQNSPESTLMSPEIVQSINNSILFLKQEKDLHLSTSNTLKIM